MWYSRSFFATSFSMHRIAISFQRSAVSLNQSPLNSRQRRDLSPRPPLLKERGRTSPPSPLSRGERGSRTGCRADYLTSICLQPMTVPSFLLEGGKREGMGDVRGGGNSISRVAKYGHFDKLNARNDHASIGATNVIRPATLKRQSQSSSTAMKSLSPGIVTGSLTVCPSTSAEAIRSSPEYISTSVVADDPCGTRITRLVS